MPLSLAGWTRLEPLTRALNPAGVHDARADEGALRADVHDPLWLLARQWQLGEFWGSDGGTPVQAVLRMDSTPITRLWTGEIPSNWFPDDRGAPNPIPGVDALRLTSPQPLESLVEREPVRADGSPRRPMLAVEAGLELLRRLDPTGAAGHRAALVARFALQIAQPDLESALAGDTLRFLSVVAQRVPDGDLLAWVVKGQRNPSTLNALTDAFKAQVSSALPQWRDWLATIPAVDRPNVDETVESWLDWYDGLFSEPDPTQPASSWLPERLEYSAAVAAPCPEGEVVLNLPEYYVGGLDWYSFDVLRGGTLGAARDDLANWPWLDPEGESVRRTVIPAPVHYPGMPASRYWEFEDARVDFGAVAAGAQQLAHLLLVEFALVYGDDWFLIPVDLAVGSLNRIKWLVVTDSFGGKTLVPSARELDRQANEGELPWDMFCLANDPRPLAGTTRPAPDALFLPPTLGLSLHGAPLEDVLLMRDEMANLAWAIERVVESPLGRPMDRAEAYHRARRDAPSPPTGLADDAVTFRYRLATDVPDHWLPLYPTRDSADVPSMRLMRGGQPLGRVMEPARSPGLNPLLVHEEEVPPEGARVTRAYQYARWIDGRTYVWLGRRKGAGHGQGSSGLRFDVLETGT